MNFYNIQHISFEQIEFFWSQHLWPERVSQIEPISLINSDGDIDISLRKYQPSFYGLFLNKNLIGVASTCQTNTIEFRLRGISLNKEFRGLGLSNSLIKKSFQHILELVDEPVVWTLSRESNFSFYQKYGFVEQKKVQGFEYGPHIILKNFYPQKTLNMLSERNSINKV